MSGTIVQYCANVDGNHGIGGINGIEKLATCVVSIARMGSTPPRFHKLFIISYLEMVESPPATDFGPGHGVIPRAVAGIVFSSDTVVLEMLLGS